MAVIKIATTVSTIKPPQLNESLRPQTEISPMVLVGPCVGPVDFSEVGVAALRKTWGG